jgi:superfamily II DNA/RNA helicase
MPSSAVSRGATFMFKASTEDIAEDQMGLNELQTLLREAAQRQDFREAGRISDILLSRLAVNIEDPPKNAEEKRARKRRMSWKGLGAAPWLIDRLDSLNYTFPTTIQINAMEAVNAILNTTSDMVENTSLEERIDMNDKDMGVVISGTTGSGKTLAYLVPLLSTLSDSLFTRQRLRVGAEENVGDTTDDLLGRIAVVTSPIVRTNSQKPIRQGPIATGAALSSLGKSGKDVKSPLALVVVPTRELGIQTAMMLYQLVGGNVKKSATEVVGKANMFKYKGPKGIKIGCILDDEEAEFGLKLQTDVAVTTPKYLSKLIADKDVDPSKLRVIVYDEADLALEETNEEDLGELFDDDTEKRGNARLTFLVGASMTRSLGDLAVKSRILPEGKSFIATATRFAPLDAKSIDIIEESMVEATKRATSSLEDLDVCLDPGLRHERVVAPKGTGLLALTRMLRKELKEYDNAVAAGTNTTEIKRPRVVVFFPDEKQAKDSIGKLRDALWGEHKVCVLLPKTGVNPLQMMQDFKDEKTSVMIATPNSVRGLDFPDLSHVYSLYLPIDDPREYVHLAGRVGRVGQMGSVKGDGGHVVSILSEDDADKMEDLAQELGFDFVDLEPLSEAYSRSTDEVLDDDADIIVEDVEEARRILEDTITLLNLAEDVDIEHDGIAGNDSSKGSQEVLNNENEREEEEGFQ